PADGDGRKWQWLSLDPTPVVADEPAAEGVAGLWDAAREGGRRFFAEYIIGLTPETQRRISEAAQEAVTDHGPRVGAGVGVVVGLGVVAGLVRRRARRGRDPAAAPPADAAPWFTRLVAVLAPRGIALAPGVTPLEYARRAAA